MTLAACSSAPPAAHTVTLAAPHAVTLAAGERPGATLDVLTGTSALNIDVGNLGTGALLRASTPRGGPLPRLHETSVGNGQPGQGTVVDLSAPGAFGYADGRHL